MSIKLSSSAATVFPDPVAGTDGPSRLARLPIISPLYALEVGPMSADFQAHAQPITEHIKRMVPWARIVYAPRLIVRHPLRPDEAATHGVFHAMVRLQGTTLPYRTTSIILASQDMQSLYRSTMAACWQALEAEINPEFTDQVSEELSGTGIVNPADYPSPAEFRAAAFTTFALAATQGLVSEPETTAEQAFADALSGELGISLNRYRDTTSLPS